MANTGKPLIIRNQIVLGIYQLIGGAWGLTLMIMYFFNSFSKTSFEIFFLMVGTLLFVFSTFCGIVCIKKENNALKLSRVNQCLQLVSLSGQNLGLMFVSGLGLFFGLDIERGLGFMFNFETSSLLMSFSEHSEDKKIAINLISLFLLFNFNVLIKERTKAELPTIE